ncbi:hypothetical protein E2C01_067330 [Portunus trituberculatus]|uniref:Uncharacterized protein n=1 Tax=Portunus trituberculatus TaxID=210409 RepID=A0A5B7HX60_PORTR|nr:hypothetical protein [Portunus trituberculatus]
MPSGSVYGSGVGDSSPALMPSGHPTTQDTEELVCTPWLPCLVGHLLHSGLGHVDNSESVPGSLPLIREDSVEAGHLAPVPGGSGVDQGLSALMPVGYPLFAAGTCENDEEEVPPNQEGVSHFLHLIGQVRAYHHLPSPEAPSSSQLMGVERAQGSVLPHQLSFTLIAGP